MRNALRMQCELTGSGFRVHFLPSGFSGYINRSLLNVALKYKTHRVPKMKRKDLPRRDTVRFMAEEHAVLVEEASFGVRDINEDDWDNGVEHVVQLNRALQVDRIKIAVSKAPQCCKLEKSQNS
jgi:hypothetical protein